jgi:hypothetical protein
MNHFEYLQETSDDVLTNDEYSAHAKGEGVLICGTIHSIYMMNCGRL